MTNRAYTSLGLRLGSALWPTVFVIGAVANEPAAECTSGHDQGPKPRVHAAPLAIPATSRMTKFRTRQHPQAGLRHPPRRPAGDYDKGVHGQARKGGNEGAPDCALCHGSAHELLPPKSQAFRTAVPDTCGMCHTDVVTQFRGSVHGQALARGITQAPLCTDCHGEHKILKHTNADSSVNNAHIRDTCGSCHGDVRLTRKFGMPGDRLISFDSSFHGLAAKSGSQTVANCASCHGVHNILPSADSNSMVNAKNLPKTCGQCHPGAGTRFAISQVHVAEGATEPDALKLVRQFYLLIIPVTIGLMLLHQGGDWLRKLIRLRFLRTRAVRGASHSADGHHDVRMLPFERVQHAVLAISFLTLVWTGFALKYPDQWWARPLLMMEGRYSMRSLIHRVAAAAFIAISLTHMISLIVNRKLREHWKDMLPNANDPREALSNFAYNLGLGSQPPGRSPHSYVEKAEYWAVIWGTFVMGLTGLMIWFKISFFSFLARWWIDIALSIHFYEAVLATLAIIVWHFYHVIFDPDVYPVNFAFIDGRMSEELYREEHELAFEQMNAERQAEASSPQPEESAPR